MSPPTLILTTCERNMATDQSAKKGFAMPRIELTYQQILEALKDMTSEEREQLAADLKARPPSLDYPVFTAHDPLWKVVGAGKGSGDPIARQQDEYLYQKDC